jgi:adenosylmethionine-8-amino-7-oxononanoate aminotransferase
MNGQTYQGHPLTVGASLEVQKIIQDENLLHNVKNMGDYLEKRLHERLDDHCHVGNIRGRGLFWGVSYERYT